MAAEYSICNSFFANYPFAILKSSAKQTSLKISIQINSRDDFEVFRHGDLFESAHKSDEKLIVSCTFPTPTT